MTELLMSGHDRTYQPPRSLRRKASEVEDSDLLTSRVAAGRCSAWDLMKLQDREDTAEWAATTLNSVVAAIEAEAQEVLGCTDCEDTGFYGLLADGNEDMVVGLLRRVGDGEYESLQADGVWQPWEASNDGAELLTLELAEDVAAAITAGAVGLLRKYSQPLAFLPPAESVVASPLADYTETGIFAVVDDDDPGAVMQLVRAGEESMTEWIDGQWEPWEAPDSELLAIPLDQEAFESITAGGFGKPGKCEYCTKPATKDIRHSEGMAYIPVCAEHLEKGKEDAAACVPSGDPDPSNIVGIVDKPLAAAGLVAYTSPDPRAEKLRRYWSTGRGGAKIRWTAPGSGDFYRCVKHLRKYLGIRAKGYCANLHKRNTGVWPGDRRNIGRRGSASLEENLVASLKSGSWSGEPERNSDMPELTDGVYCEVDDHDAGLLRTLVAGGFPVAPPDDWYTNPGFEGPTPMQVDDDGRVRGHIATWDVTHIGMAGSVHAPKSKSGYAYFQTGQLKTASGKTVNVGQLTLAGGHAPIHASAKDAVKHYDDTNSAVADVTVGEDAYGIWAAGSLRPNITPEQIRTFRASPLSGDWRPIGGNLELVAACAVNVPGFPIAQALAAGGAIVALVAAGARPLAQRQAALTADAIILERLDALESRIPAPDPEPAPEPEVTPEVVPETVIPVDPEPAVEAEPEAVVVEEPEPVAASTAVAEAPVLEEQVEEAVAAAEQETPDEVQPEATDKLDPEEVAQARADAAAIRRDWLRQEVHGTGGVTAAIPPQFLKNVKAKQDGAKKIPETERKGGGYPIKDEKSLKDAIQAVGRAKPEDRAKTIAHIKAAAKKLGLTKLLPSTPGW